MKRSAGLAGESQKAETKEEFVKVKKRDLERLTTEVMQLRDFLPKILNGSVLESFQKSHLIETSMEKREQELEQLRMDCKHFKARLETAQADSMREKKSKAVIFFAITGQTMESFVKSLGEDTKQQDLDSDENQFVLALAGIVTNVAALACGREFLVNSSRELLDTMIQLLGDMKPGFCTKLKVLMLMSLYNVSINLKGLKYISESPGFIPLLWWLLKDPDAEVCLHVLRLLQSVILEPEVLAKSAPEMRDTLPFQRIKALSKSRNVGLQTLAQELLDDLKILEYEV
ncbi:PREDICTED: heat shock factor 2-binding protein isoform X2 [Gavialis gangeticus]|uniref:heat shock factor 2-binding protein isoform X2 n=1 Tax=Gavialis gangeticus TaxID=94835 RepID=UPI00092E718F|nr:PREDICTED: heat shock factor 2-binding protein isoform X2 [Gavialis gangeticus]